MPGRRTQCSTWRVVPASSRAPSRATCGTSPASISREVRVDPSVPVPEWGLSEVGRARMQRCAARLVGRGIGSLWSSCERKAVEAAAIVAGELGLRAREHSALAENDRSATGYLPKDRFERIADRFFAQPENSIAGWERALDAQQRIISAIDHVIAHSDSRGNIAVVAHGAVGTLLLCKLKGIAITRHEDQPSQGHVFSFEFEGDSRRLLHGWQAIDSGRDTGIE
jgi:broad specificity phosphatase PhoE